MVPRPHRPGNRHRHEPRGLLFFFCSPSMPQSSYCQFTATTSAALCVFGLERYDRSEQHYSEPVSLAAGASLRTPPPHQRAFSVVIIFHSKVNLPCVLLPTGLQLASVKLGSTLLEIALLLGSCQSTDRYTRFVAHFLIFLTERSGGEKTEASTQRRLFDMKQKKKTHTQSEKSLQKQQHFASELLPDNNNSQVGKLDTTAELTMMTLVKRC